MTIRTMTSRTVSAAITAARFPLSTALDFVPVIPERESLRGAINRADSLARSVAGAILNDERLLNEAEPREHRANRRRTVRHAEPGEAVSGFPEPPGRDPGKISDDPEPHHSLSNPVGDPDPTEWPDPYETRSDPRDPPDPDQEPFGEEPHVDSGSLSTSEPHPLKDPEAGGRSKAPKRERLDD
jgi:hypothetical protein